MVFKPAKLDTAAVVVTIIVCALLVGLSVLFLVKVPYGWLWAVGMMLIPAISYALSPRQYRFEGSSLAIRKVLGRTIRIPVSEIQGYALIHDLAKIRMVRLFGNGGLFGHYGMFSMARYGPVNCQLTRMKDVVIVQTKSMRYALSPRDPEAFVHMLVSITSCATIPLETPQPRSEPDVHPAILILPAVLYLITILAVVLAFRSLPDRIAVHFDAFGTPDRWGSKVSYLLSGLIPSTILLVINCGVYFGMRRMIRGKRLLLLLVVLIAWIQAFTLFIQIDTYWINTRDVHIIPFGYALGVFIGMMIVLLFVYYGSAVPAKR